MATERAEIDIPFHIPHLSGEAWRLVGAVLRSNWLTTGTRVAELERGIKQLLGIKDDVLALSSCTAALHLAYLSLELKKGDEVIVPSLTFCSTANMIVHAGATPVFCDVDEQTLCLDARDVESKITSNTKAVVVVHFGGMPADLEGIHRACRSRKIPIIEDAAHALLAVYKGKNVGSHGNISCFSFYATKALTTAEGGLIVMPKARDLKRARILALHGLSKDAWSRYARNGSWRYRVLLPGYKYNMSDVHAAIGLSQLQYALKDREARSRIANEYRRVLKSVRGIVLPIDPPMARSKHAWHLFTIRMRTEAIRDGLIRHLRRHGVGTSVHFQPNHLQPFYRRIRTVRLPVTEKVGKTILSLPIYPTLGYRSVHRIATLIKQYVHDKAN